MARNKVRVKVAKPSSSLKCIGDICVTDDGRVEVKVDSSCSIKLREKIANKIGVEGRGVEIVLPPKLDVDRDKKLKQIDDSMEKLRRMKEELTATS